MAQAVLLASTDPLAGETEGAPGWQTYLADDATGLRWHVRPALSTKPMEAEPVDDLPRGRGWLYEPKYDGFRCLAFRDGDDIQLQSKKQKSLNRFFPEVAA